MNRLIEIKNASGIGEDLKLFTSKNISYEAWGDTALIQVFHHSSGSKQLFWEHVFRYGSDDIIDTIATIKADGDTSSFLVFAYDADGALTEQNRFTFNADGKYLHSTTTYQPDDATPISSLENRGIRIAQQTVLRKCVNIQINRETVLPGLRYKLNGARAGKTSGTAGAMANGLYIKELR